MKQSNTIKNHTITYCPQGPYLEGYTGIFHTTRLMFLELRNAQELILRFFIRDISSKYRQSLLGILWVFFIPLITAGIFVVIRKAGILTIEDLHVPYILYALIGISMFHLFNGGLVACTNAIVRAGRMVVKINFPKIALVIAASFQAIIEFFIRLLLIIIIFFLFHITPNLFWITAGISALIPLYLFMLGIGFILSLGAGVLRDIPAIINFIGMGIMLLTPILYPINPNSFLGRITIWNPLHYLVNFPRDIILQGHSSLTIGYIICSIFSAVICYLGWRLFFIAQTKIAERI